MAIDDFLDKRDFRYEYKFPSHSLTKYELESLILLNPKGFSEIYYERFVNSLYFDDHNMKSYFENEAGLSERVKIRVRWYGDLFGFIQEPILEFKIKKNDLGSKASYPLKSFHFDQNFSAEKMREVFLASDLPLILKKELQGMEFAVLTRYQRKYFLSFDEKFRFTIDSDICFFQPQNFFSCFADRKITVIELKFKQGDQEEAQRISSFFPLRRSKNSKYVLGVESRQY